MKRLPVFSKGINGYSDPAQSAKDHFLSQSAAFCRTIYKMLNQTGVFDESSVRSNPGGIAVSGEVYAEFCKKGEDVGILMEVCQPCLGGRFCRQQDGVGIRVVWRCRRRDHCSTPEGRNNWIAPEGNGEAYRAIDVANKLERILKEGKQAILENVSEPGFKIV